MKTLIRIIPVITLALSLAACGNDHSTTTTTSDTATLNGSPMGNTATDNTGTGIQGGTEGGSSTGNTSTNTGGSGNGAGGNMSSSTSTGNAAGGTGAGTGSGTGSTTVLQGERTNANRGGSGRDRVSPNDSVNNRTGLAPSR